jgi:LacI family transcriptional regulator
MLGLIVSDITNPFFPELVKGFEDAALHRGYEIMLSSTNYDPARMAQCVRRMIERKVEGVAIMTSEMDQQLIDQLLRRKVPTVFLDVGVVHALISNILVDYAAGIDEAVQHLLGLGHRRIGFISGPIQLKSASIRRSAFLACLERARLLEDVELVREGDHTIDGGLEAMTGLIEARDPPTAVLASNDLTAIGALRAARGMGWSVPADVSIVGFDDIRFASFTEPPLTTVALSRSELAERAIDALLNNRHFGSECLVKPALVIRGSTAPPRTRTAPVVQ